MRASAPLPAIRCARPIGQWPGWPGEEEAMVQPAELQSLRNVSARVGRDIRLVQGAGGNTSLKADGVLWVKASGAWLMEADQRDIFVPVDLPGALRALEQGIERMPVADPAAKLRPSIETSLHALLPHR